MCRHIITVLKPPHIAYIYCTGNGGKEFLNFSFCRSTKRSQNKKTVSIYILIFYLFPVFIFCKAQLLSPIQFCITFAKRNIWIIFYMYVYQNRNELNKQTMTYTRSYEQTFIKLNMTYSYNCILVWLFYKGNYVVPCYWFIGQGLKY